MIGGGAREGGRSRESGGTGRRTRLRIWPRKGWGFDSPLSHSSWIDRRSGSLSRRRERERMEGTQVSVEELGATRRRLDVEIPESAVRAELDRAYGRVQKHARIPGFRQGKVPRTILEKHFGDQVRADVLSHLIEHSYTDAVSDKGLRPVGPPEIVPENVEAGRPLRYTAMVDVWPEIRIGHYEGLEARRPVRAVTDEHVERAIEQIRESLADLRPIEGRDVAATGDFATFDYEVTAGGKPLGEGKRENRLAEIGAGQMPTEVDEGLIGMSIGETKTFEVEFPEEHPDTAVAGKRVSFVVTLRGIREKVRPEVDDDLAREHGECETLEELRNRLREQIAASFAADGESSVRDQLIDRLLEKNPFEVPESLVERQVEGMIDELLNRLGPQADPVRHDAERLGKMREDFRPRAEGQVRAVLALEALARQLSIDVGDDEVAGRIDEMAARAGQNAQRLRTAYAEPPAREELRSRMQRERALSAVVDAARIEDEEADVAAPPEKS